MNNFYLFLTSISSNEKTNDESSSSTTERLGEALNDLLKNPVFYIVVGGIFLLIIVAYFLRRIVKPRPYSVSVIIRKGSIYKLIDDKSSSYFMVPFADRLGAVISLTEKELSSDKLFINNGPDALYQVNYTLKYKVADPKEFYKYNDDIDNLIIARLNDYLREFADGGNALVLVKDYRQNSAEILELINKAIKEYYVEALSFKINLIQPLGR